MVYIIIINSEMKQPSCCSHVSGFTEACLHLRNASRTNKTFSSSGIVRVAQRETSTENTKDPSFIVDSS